MKNQKAISGKSHTLIISDLHLGSKVSRSKRAVGFLKTFQFKKLILLGDIFEKLDFTHLQESDWEFLSLVGKLSKTKKVIWVEGNHDLGIAKIFIGPSNVRVKTSYYWKYQNKRYLAMHGHQFDNFLVENAFLGFVANQVYNAIQIIDFKDKRISRFIKGTSKGWLRLSKKVAERALLYAKLQGVDYIFCGHTHKTLQKKSGKTHYYNCGCWTDIPSGYITIDKSEIRVNKYF
jgi:UDP-2,3-diacylglucosamine pyrophosphatase LpxH